MASGDGLFGVIGLFQENRASAAPIHITPAMPSAQNTAAEPISLTVLMMGSICGVVRSHNFSMLVFNNSTASTANKIAINSARRNKSGVSRKAQGTAATRTATSKRKERSVLKALARPARETFKALIMRCLLKIGRSFDGWKGDSAAPIEQSHEFVAVLCLAIAIAR